MRYKLYLDDCVNVINSNSLNNFIGDKRAIVVTDPPFNIGYHYNKYSDNMKQSEYLNFVGGVLNKFSGFVLIHYPEDIYKISLHINRTPERVVSWVYNSNTARQHRDIAFFGIKPDFNLVRQPYKNLNDKRIQKRISEGKTGAKIYDWWNINQVKNVSKDKTIHPCQMPQEVMDNVIGIIQNKNDIVIIDPFMGSCTTGLACMKYDIDFIGVEIDEQYYQLSKQRMEEHIIDNAK